MPSFYTLAIPPVIRGLKNASGILAYAENYAKANGVDPEEYLSASLYPDMRDFRFQVNTYSNFARFAVERVAKDVEPLSLPEVEKPSFADLNNRVQTVIKYLEAVKPEQFEGQEDKEIVVHVGPNKEFEMRFNAVEYIHYFNSTNFWFHHTTAYDILRHKGVDLGKRHFLNASQEIPVTVLQK